MFRIESSPDRPMFLRREGPPAAAGDELVVCVGSSVAETELLRLVPHRRVRVEPDAATAIRLCLEEPAAAGLLIDIAPLGFRALSALGHLRLMRPELQLFLLTVEDGGADLQGTLLEGLPVFALPRRLPSLEKLLPR